MSGYAVIKRPHEAPEIVSFKDVEIPRFQPVINEFLGIFKFAAYSDGSFFPNIVHTNMSRQRTIVFGTLIVVISGDHPLTKFEAHKVCDYMTARAIT